ncbi:unnamed protein product [Cylindrotheca closterium]|uniref:Uncharacterized protein n=1 Tax=Cylindrotheca closterium TaxID=2856 RepID=A0AAD2FVG9_9STRA|nr:unnamed protein product [Cylindrotheca closterium]
MNAERRPPPLKHIPPSSPPPKERVLHSIFSPSYHTDKQGDKEEVQIGFHSPPRRSYATSTEEGPAIVGATLSTQPNNLSPMSAISAFTAGTSHWQQEKNRRRTITSTSDDALNTSVDTLKTIEMLNFKFIRSCDSPDRLERVLKVLNSTKRDSPLLLQETKDRLSTLRQTQNQQNGAYKSTRLLHQTEMRTEFESPGKEYFSSCAANISRITNGNSTLDSIDPTKTNSLNLSLSPQSVLHGVEFVDTPYGDESTSFFQPSAITETPNRNEIIAVEKRLTPIEERTGSSPVPPPPPPPPPSRPIDSHKTKEKVHGSFLQKLQNLETAKKEAEKVVENLQSQVHEANNKTKHMQTVVREMTKEKKKQHEEAEKERKTFEAQQRQATTVEKGLQERVSSLIEQLRQTEEKARLVMRAEKNIRVEREKQLSHVQHKNQELNAMLEKAKQNLESMKQRQATFRMELFRCMGLSIDEWRNSSSRDLLAELSKKMSMMSEENRNAKIEIQSRLKIAEERERLEAQLQKTIDEKKQLQEENSKLSDRIQDLAEEVESSRAYIDKLLRTSHDANQDDWETREKKYKTVIQNLRQQIRKQGSTVKLDLYKSALDDGKRKSQDLQEANKRIATLVAKVVELEKTDKTSSALGHLPSPEGKQAVRRVAESPTEYLNGETNTRSLGKPIRHIMGIEQTNDEIDMRPIPFKIDQSYEKMETKTPIQRRKSQTKTPKSHDKSVSVITQHKSPDYQNAWTKRRNKDDLLGFEVLIPAETIETSEQRTSRFKEADFNVWNDNYVESPQLNSKTSNYPSRNKFVQKHLNSGKKKNKSPLLERKERRQRQEEAKRRELLSQSKEDHTGTTLTPVSKKSTPPHLVGDENVDPAKSDCNSADFAPVSSPRKSTPRELARQAGGRRALAEKVRKMRSPSSKVRTATVQRIR